MRLSENSDGGPLTIAIGGGKGGVGKTVVAANVAAAIARLGMRVVAIDTDLGSANLHTLFGIERPGKTLHALLNGEISSLEEAIVPTSEPRLFLIPGSDGIPGAANLVHARKLKLVRHIQRLDAEAIVIDCGAGINYNVLDFFIRADRHLFVVVPQLVSMQNCYGFLKASLYRAIRNAAMNNNEMELLNVMHTAS